MISGLSAASIAYIDAGAVLGNNSSCSCLNPTSGREAGADQGHFLAWSSANGVPRLPHKPSPWERGPMSLHLRRRPLNFTGSVSERNSRAKVSCICITPCETDC